MLLQFNQVSPNGLIVLYASRDARYEDVVTVLDVLRSVGGDRVALATIPRNVDANPEGDPLKPVPGRSPRGRSLLPPFRRYPPMAQAYLLKTIVPRIY